jgi:hypothetical protein
MVPFFAGNTLPLQWQMASDLPLIGGYLSRKPVYPLSDGVPPFTEMGLNGNPFRPWFDRAASTVCRPLPSEATHLDILRLAGVRYVAVDATYTPEYDWRILAARRMFPAGPVYSNGTLTIYDTAGGEPPPSLFGAVENMEDWLWVEEGKFRWTSSNYARLHVWSGSDRTASLRFKLTSFGQDRNFSVAVDDVKLVEGNLSTDGTNVEVEWQATKGFSTLLITASGQPVVPYKVGKGPDYRPLVMRLSECSYSSE